ncbi:hypothetical protein ACRALDRAFT_1075233 [Sodiomyces alcalophilus JCM 7366]|uniref:uncharacterized protein n=1 Tax=Sodiomyces alcalophilus JCM 7366 TaxID=591952 RepID=UPI0039B38222
MSSTATPKSANLFQVYLRLRPPPAGSTNSESFLTVESEEGRPPTHIILNPPNDRKRSTEKFAFTQVFEEDASQLDVFQCTGVAPLIEGVLAPHGGEGTDALLATLGVTGSGKTHTILGSRTQRGMTQLALDVLFRSIGYNMVDTSPHLDFDPSLQTSDVADASLMSAPSFLETVYSDFAGPSRAGSRAATPMIADHHHPATTSKRHLQRPSSVPQLPDVRGVNVSSDPSAEYAVVLSMYEVYNDKIYDLLSPPIRSNATKEYRRRPLLFKSTEQCTDRKVVAGLRKVVCQTLREAILVLEAGLHERQVAGTGSNSVSSRSHGFFSVEVKKRPRSGRSSSWTTSTFTIVDLAGSERARDAKTQGSTLAEAGKINESLMYLGQCLQAQSGLGNSSKPSVMPFRQCKMTELLFSNSFSTTSSSYTASVVPRRNAQRGVMIVTADPHGDVNATSQILRYSALAREVTIPRIPSITSTLLAETPPHSGPSPSHVSHHPSAHSRPHVAQHARGTNRDISTSSHGEGDRVIMEHAALEIARMQDDINNLHAELDREREARVTAEAHLLSMEDRMLDLEQTIREDCAAEYEARFDLEVARWKASMAVQQERSEEHWDRKMELFERGLDDDDAAHDDGDAGDDDDKENVLVENLEEENERLRRELAVLKRELGARSPTRRMPLHERDDYSGGGRSNADVYGGRGALGSLGRKMEQLRVSNSSVASSVASANTTAANTTATTATSTGSPKKTMRKLATKRWE